MPITTTRQLAVLSFFLSSAAAVKHFTSRDTSPAQFIYQASMQDINAEKYSFTDALGKAYNDAVWAQYAYPTPSAGSDLMILDPDNPANIIMYVRSEPDETLALPGGYIVDMVEPFLNSLQLLNKKIKLRDSDEPIPVGMGTAGIPRMEDMFLDQQLNVGPVLGVIGFKDRAPEHIVCFTYHVVLESGITSELVPNDDKVKRVVSVKMVDLLVKGIDLLLPGDSKNGHFLTEIEIPEDDELGDAALPLHHDHLKQVYKFFRILVNRGLLTEEGELEDDFEDLNYLYQIVEEDDEEEIEDIQSEKTDTRRIDMI